mmetsp:Transcript_22978/g.59762  ORF Transcript_22978/g.59762 Transcript_22978/m.59762 type:complete len:299 (+) Transcript_22978:4006-4902(+)
MRSKMTACLLASSSWAFISVTFAVQVRKALPDNPFMSWPMTFFTSRRMCFRSETISHHRFITLERLPSNHFARTRWRMTSWRFFSDSSSLHNCTILTHDAIADATFPCIIRPKTRFASCRTYTLSRRHSFHLSKMPCFSMFSHREATLFKSFSRASCSRSAASSDWPAANLNAVSNAAHRDALILLAVYKRQFDQARLVGLSSSATRVKAVNSAAPAFRRRCNPWESSEEALAASRPSLLFTVSLNEDMENKNEDRSCSTNEKRMETMCCTSLERAASAGVLSSLESKTRSSSACKRS